MTNHSLIISCFAILCSLFVTSCGDDSGSSAESTRKIENKTITGVAQKGPFIQGSAITIFELDEDLKRTDFSIKTVTNDQGEFSVKVNNPASPSAIFKVNGIYLNEITGEESHNKVSLYAFTDMSKRNEVNINVLTHLSHKRALYLASEKGLSVDSAKKQAETEVLNAFGIDENFDDAEDLNISGEDDQNAALLAMSVLMQGGIPDDALNRILSEAASDFEKDGTWDDAKTATLIADWAYKQYVNYKLAKIPSNLKKWKLLTNVALLKKYMNSYWHHNYGLESCTEKRQNEVRRNKNYMSNYDSFYFICNSKEWREATEKEIDRYYKPDSSESSENNSNKKKEGDVRGKEAEYSGEPMTCEVYENYAWREGNPSDCKLGFGGCTKKLQGIIRQNSDGVQYVCDHRRWLSIDDCKKILGCELSSEIPNLGWNNAKNGEIRTDKKTGLVYVFDLVAWRLATIPEASLGGCTEEILDSVGYASKREDQIDSVHNCQYNQRMDENFCTNGRLEEGYYQCVSAINTTYDPQKEKFDQTKHYKTYKWVKMTGPETDIYMLNKGEKAEMGESSWGPINKDKCYVFEWNWREGDVTECILGLGGCISSRSGTIELGPAIKIDCGEYSCISYPAKRRAEIIEGAEERKYVCHYGNSKKVQYPLKSSWDLATSTDIDVAPATCTNQNDYEIITGVENMYACHSQEFKLLWTKELQTYDNIEQAKCNNINSNNYNSGQIVSDKTNKYVCDKDTFRLATPLEIEMGIGCTDRTSNYYKKMNGTQSYFTCTAKYGSGITTYKWIFRLANNQKSMTDPRDHLTYETISIGPQTWMTENLRYADSANYPSMRKRTWSKEGPHAIGLQYTWSAVIDSVYWASKGKTCGNTSNSKACGLPEKVQGICPDGWHIPTLKECELLETNLTTWEIDFSKIRFANAYLGNYDPDATSSDRSDFNHVWTSTEIDGAKASEWKIGDRNELLTDENEKRIGNAVRCVKDD